MQTIVAKKKINKEKETKKKKQKKRNKKNKRIVRKQNNFNKVFKRDLLVGYF